MHDARGKALKKGDLVLVPAKIVEVSEGPDYCNVTIESQIGRRPDGQKERWSALNTGVLIKVSPNDE